MTNRREFFEYSMALTLASSLQVLAQEQRQLPTRLIPGTDESLAIVGLGNSSSFRDDDLSTASKLLDIFLDHGGRYVDVGGASAFSVGKLGQEKNATEQLFLGNYIDPAEEQDMRKRIAGIASAQGKSALDLIHTRDIGGYRSSYDAYRALKEEGLVRFIGVARSGAQNHDAMGRLIEDGLVDFIQVNFSLMEPEAGERLLPLAADNGVAVSTSRPFLNGNYFGIVRGHELPEWAAEFDCESWAQFSLKFILANPAVNCVLTETADPAHALDNLGAGFGRLPDTDMQQRMLEHMRSISG